MKKYHIRSLFIPLLILVFMTLLQAAEKEKIAQTGFEFLSVISDARAAALGNAVNSFEFGSSSLFFNPAGMARLNTFFDISASDNRWIAGIHHNTFSIAINPMGGLLGVFGFSFQTIDYGDKFYGTVVAKNEKGFIDTGDLSPRAYAAGFGYAKAVSDKFAVGGQVRLVKQDFGDLWIPLTDTSQVKKSYALSPLAFDFGTLFKTGIKSLTFGMSIRNFSKEIKYIEDGFQLPLVFTLGISADLVDFFMIGGPKQSAVLTIDAKHYRSHAEQVLVGLDYKFMNILSLRTGYISNNGESGMNFGAGISMFDIHLDYAYTPYGIFNDVQRMTVRFAF